MKVPSKRLKTMKIAVSSQNFRSVTGHAGRTRRFVIFDAQPGAEMTEVARLDLPKDMCIHEYSGDEPHPLDEMDVILSAGFGDGFAQKMARRGVSVAVTRETEPAKAAAAYAASDAGGRTGTEAPLGSGTSPGAHRHQHRHGCGCGASQST